MKELAMGERDSHAKGEKWVDQFSYVFNLLADFVYRNKEFRNVNWLKAKVKDLDLIV